MDVRLTGEPAASVPADVVGAISGSGPAIALGATEGDGMLLLPGPGSGSRKVVVVPGTAEDEEGLRSAAARAVRAAGAGASVAWTFDAAFPGGAARQVRALAEGAVLGAYESGRWKTTAAAPPASFTICGAPDGLDGEAAAGAESARWTNLARELVDAPPNLMRPGDLAERARALGVDGLEVDVLDPVGAGLPALQAVGRGSDDAPVLIVLRYDPADAPDTPVLGLVGKGVTYDSGGYFLKPQSDIVRQKGDMAGGAAVIAALAAIATARIPLRVLGVVAAAENMIGATAMRPSDVIRTAAGLTVEVTNPDAEGRLILADALWFARTHGATHLVDLATLTGALRAGMGDLYGGVFANDDAWRTLVVDSGNATGDLAWPWPLHERYERLLDSRVADLKNTSGKGYGYPITAATFLRRFAGTGPWAHIDMIGPALLDDDRGDAFGVGATGWGVRLLRELAQRLATAG